MFCSNCGTQNEDGNAFCSKCGNPLQATPVNQAAPVNPVYTAPVYTPAPKKKFDIKNPAAILQLVALSYSLICPFFKFVTVDAGFYEESVSLVNWGGSPIFSIPIFLFIIVSIVFVFLPYKIAYAICAGLLVFVEAGELIYIRHYLGSYNSAGITLKEFLDYGWGHHLLIISIILVTFSIILNFLIVKKDGKYGLV